MKHLLLLLMAIVGVVVLMKYDSKISLARNENANVAEKKHQTEISQKSTQEVKEAKVVAEISEPKQKPMSDSNYEPMGPNALLDNGEFAEVVAVYSGSDGAKKSEYESALVQYLTVLAVSNPILAKKQIVSFLEVNPNSPVIDALIEIYASNSEYDKIIEILRDLRENYTEGLESSLVLTKIHENAKKEIDYLTKQQDYQAMLGFLDKMIDYDDIGGLYSLELAQSYLNLGRMNDALEVLESLEYDQNYYMKAKKIKSDIASALETGRYKYALDLKKNGEHYFLDVELDGRVYKLLLDTGASYIMIDSDKSADFEVLNDNITMQTAGDPVDAQMRKATLLHVGDIELDNVKFISSPFERENMDGLLGMNFFKRFEFHIDQDKNILYLNPK